jgi:predicted nucleotide-binding protein
MAEPVWLVNDPIPDSLGEIERNIDYWTDQLSECSAGSERKNKIEARLKRLERAKEKLLLAPSKASSRRRVFIGHGRSLVWHQLKDFLSDRLHLVCDEFNAEAVAGITTVDRLQTLLDNAGFAFLVMTAEDIHADSSTHARENVIHEAGLFQGKLGFKSAIILLEEGCVQFSNIHGLSHIGFPKGNLEPTFEKVRQVLEREQILQTATAPHSLQQITT